MTNMIQTMKRIFYSLCLLWSLATTASAYDFMKDGIYYNILSESELTCEITKGSNNYFGSIVIPTTVEHNGYTYSVTKIGSRAFYDCYALTSIDIPNSVTSIGYQAFYGCDGLTSINIPNSVTNIGEQAFYRCEVLTGLRIEDGSTTLTFASYVFYNTPLSAVYIGRNWDCSSSNISDYPFYGNSSIQSVTLSDFVTRIGHKAFYGCDGLTSINIPNSVTSIGNSAFSGCSALTAINIPSSVTSIGDYAFESCYALTSINIPNSVTSIGNSAFSDCELITSINIPNSVTSIGDSAFESCTALTDLHIEDGNTSLTFGSDVFDGVPLSTVYIGRDWDCSGSYSSDYPFYKSSIQSVTLSDFVTRIGDKAFYDCNALTSINIPNSVTNIGYQAFYGCDGLTSINIPNSVTSIGDGAFYDCDALTSINIPNSVTNIGEQAFYSCEVLTGLRIEDGSTSLTFGSDVFNGTPLSTVYIGRDWDCSGSYSSSYPFYGNSSISSVTLSDFVTRIGNYAFSSCYGLTSVNIPNSVTSIGSGAFYGCYKLTSINIPNSVTSIGNSAFSGCYGLTSVNIPNSVTSIGDSAFSSCLRLTSVNIPNSVTSIGNSAFSGCGLTSINIPNSVTSIGYQAFYGCDGLTSVNIPNSVTSIGNRAFSDCFALTDLHIEDGNTSLTFGSNVFNGTPLYTVYIGRNWDCSSSNSYDYPFYGNSNISSVTIGNSVISIRSNAFYGCTDLHSVTIGTGVLSIGTDAFSYKDSNNVSRTIGIEKVIWLPNTPPKGNEEINGTYEYASNNSYGSWKATVYPYLSSLFEVGGIKYVPVSPSERTCAAIDCAYDDTKEIRIGKTVHYQGIELSLLDIRPALCYGNDSIETLHIEGYAGSIVEETFYDCSNLKTATLKDVTGIGIQAFYDCEKLSGIALPNTVASLGASCFSGCASLGYAEIGSGIRELPDACFSGCAALTDMVIPATVERIADGVFQGCTSLAYVTLCDRDTELALGSNGSEPMFADCPLNTVYIGGDITYPTESSKGYSPFYRNTSLETVQITDKETEISENEFYGCTNLKNVTLGNGIEQIGNYAFSGCASLDNFTFGTNMKSIGEEAFSDCTAMTSLVSYTVVPPVCGTQALDDINKWTCKLFVPDEAIPNYQQADQWKEFFFAYSTHIDGDLAETPADELSRILEGPVQVYNLSGTLLRQMKNAASVSEALSGLERGIYILQGNGLSRKVTR